MPTVVDVHAHYLVPEVYAVTAPHSIFNRVPPDATEQARRAAEERAQRFIARMADHAERLAAMDRMGVDVQVLSPSLVHQDSGFADAQTALELCRRTNDALAAAVATAPGRYRGLGMVPLHHPDLAAAELARCMEELGLSGVTIPTRAGGHEIGEAPLWPFWATAQRTGAVVFVHPAGNPDPRLARYMMWNSLGQCMEETFAIASLFYDGVLDAYPELRICISHGGGYMPYNFGRVSRNYVEKPLTRRNMTRPPEAYLRMLHYDSCLYDPVTLNHLVARMGADRVLLGSDYPMGEADPVGLLAAAGLDEAARAAILGGNAARLFGLKG